MSHLKRDKGLPLAKKGLIKKRRGQRAANTLTPGAGDFRASPPVNAESQHFPMDRPPTVFDTVGGRFFPPGQP